MSAADMWSDLAEAEYEAERERLVKAGLWVPRVPTVVARLPRGEWARVRRVKP